MNEQGQNSQREVIPGITLSSTGQATVAPGLGDVLFDLAVKLDDALPYPVDVQHILAAIILAADAGELKPDTRLAVNDVALETILARHLRTVFTRYGGKVGQDD